MGWDNVSQESDVCVEEKIFQMKAQTRLPTMVVTAKVPRT